MAPLKPIRLSDRFFVPFLRGAIHTIPWKAWWIFWPPSEHHILSLLSKWEAEDDLSVDCEQSVRARPRGQIYYFRLSRLFADKCYVCTTRGYDAQFLRRFLELRWDPQSIVNGSKILSMIVENLHFLDSLNYLPMGLKCMPKSLDLTFKKR